MIDNHRLQTNMARNVTRILTYSLLPHYYDHWPVSLLCEFRTSEVRGLIFRWRFEFQIPLPCPPPHFLDPPLPPPLCSHPFTPKILFYTRKCFTVMGFYDGGRFNLRASQHIYINRYTFTLCREAYRWYPPILAGALCTPNPVPFPPPSVCHICIYV